MCPLQNRKLQRWFKPFILAICVDFLPEMTAERWVMGLRVNVNRYKIGLLIEWQHLSLVGRSSYLIYWAKARLKRMWSVSIISNLGSLITLNPLGIEHVYLYLILDCFIFWRLCLLAETACYFFLRCVLSIGEMIKYLLIWASVSQVVECRWPHHSVRRWVDVTCTRGKEQKAKSVFTHVSAVAVRWFIPDW